MSIHMTRCWDCIVDSKGTSPRCIAKPQHSRPSTCHKSHPENRSRYRETNVPGAFAAGDVTDVPEKQIVVAAGEGAKAALQAQRYLQRLEAPVK